MYYDWLESPIGIVTVEADDADLLSVMFASSDRDGGKHPKHPNTITDQCKSELEAYFLGASTEFSVPIRFAGTPFQQKVWGALLDIPFGETRTYGYQAARLGNPKAVRAVGAANGKNRINIIVPCHRVIGANGRLTGYGGGIDRKKWLLDHEQSMLGGDS